MELGAEQDLAEEGEVGLLAEGGGGRRRRLCSRRGKEREGRGGERKMSLTSRPHVTGEGKGKAKNLAAGVLFTYKLKVGKEISLYDEKGNMEKSNCWSCS